MTVKLSSQMLDILAVLAKEDGRSESDFVGYVPEKTNLFGQRVYGPKAKRYASISRSLRRLCEAGLIRRRRKYFDAKGSASRGYWIFIEWWLTEKGKLTVKQRNLTDRIPEGIKPFPRACDIPSSPEEEARMKLLEKTINEAFAT